MTGIDARTVNGIDAARRVGWAKFYDAENVAVAAVAHLLAVRRLLADWQRGEAHALVARALSRLGGTEQGRDLIEKALDANGYLREWMEDGLLGAPPPEPPLTDGEREHLRRLLQRAARERVKKVRAARAKFGTDLDPTYLDRSAEQDRLASALHRKLGGDGRLIRSEEGS